MEFGDGLIYRLSTFEPSERVRIVAEHPGKQSSRYDVEFLEGEKAGTIENVPARRLKGRWSEVAAYDDLMSNWEWLDQSELTEPEQLAVERVFRLLLPAEVVQQEWKPVRWVTRILDQEALTACTGLVVAELLEDVEWFELDGDVLVSPAGTLMIAEAACRMNPDAILGEVEAEEKEYRERALHGREVSKHARTGERYWTSPEQEYETYLKHGRPIHELLRAWSGHRAVTGRERIEAAEAEVRRLDRFVLKLIGELKRHEPKDVIDDFLREFDEGQITQANYRPVVNRPVDPSKIVVYEAPRRRRRIR